jgi:FkbM family methyltransferase
LFRDVLLSGDYDPGPLQNPRPVIVDVGANIGLSVLYFKLLFPAATIYAFEPNPGTFVMLRENVLRNGLKDVVLFNEALGQEEGTALLYTSGELGEMTASLTRGRGGSQGLPVQVRRLSDVLRHIGAVDFIKLDCEGAELSILQDLEKTKTLTTIHRMVVEYHHMLPDEPSTLARFLQILETAKFDYTLSAPKVPFDSDPPFQDVLLRIYRRQLRGRPQTPSAQQFTAA